MDCAHVMMSCFSPPKCSFCVCDSRQAWRRAEGVRKELRESRRLVKGECGVRGDVEGSEQRVRERQEG